MTIARDKVRRNALRRDLYEKLGTSGETVPTTVKSLRRMLALDQAAFAALVNLSLSTLRKIEQSRGNVTLATLNKILGKFSLKLVVRTK